LGVLTSLLGALTKRDTTVLETRQLPDLFGIIGSVFGGGSGGSGGSGGLPVVSGLISGFLAKREEALKGC